MYIYIYICVIIHMCMYMSAEDSRREHTLLGSDAEILDEIEDDVIRFAAESPEPPVSEVEKYVLAENDPWVRGGVQ